MLGSDDLYRERGYTALSRHRDEARFYVVAPASVERNLPGVEPDHDPLVEQLKEMLGDSPTKNLALDHLPDAGAEAIQESLTRFSLLVAEERRARSDRERAEEMREATEKRLAQLRDERGALGRLFHRQDRAELDDHIAGHERVLAHWDDSVQRADQALAASAAERDAGLEEHGEATLALVRAEQQRRADELNELRSDLVMRAQHDRQLDPGEQDVWAVDAVAEMRAAEPPPPELELDIGPDLGP